MKHYGDITKLSGYDLPIVDVITGGSYKVYMYRFPDGKAYIGMTRHELRYRKDCGYQHNKRLSEALAETGWKNVEKLIIQDGLSKAEAESLEIMCINALKTTSEEYGYNVSIGGSATFKGLRHTKEYKERMSALRKGKQFSKEHIRHLREAHAKERHAVTSIDPNSMVVTHYDSLRDAADSVNGYKSNISRACQVEGRLYKGLLWRNGVV